MIVLPNFTHMILKPTFQATSLLTSLSTLSEPLLAVAAWREIFRQQWADNGDPHQP